MAILKRVEEKGRQQAVQDLPGVLKRLSFSVILVPHLGQVTVITLSSCMAGLHKKNTHLIFTITSFNKEHTNLPRSTKKPTNTTYKPHQVNTLAPTLQEVVQYQKSLVETITQDYPPAEMNRW